MHNKTKQGITVARSLRLQRAITLIGGCFANALTGGFVSTLLGDCAFAQIIPDRTLGTEGSMVTPNVNINGGLADQIDGGAIRGANLFHSFEQFNIGDGQRVYFANPVGIENILSRVTGTNASNILGTLGVTGGNANLFLMNPNGIIFGENARLDVGGSFVATTANAIQFGDRGFFNASEPNLPPLLTIAPSAFLFNQIAAQSTITVNSNRYVGTFRPSNSSDVKDYVGLDVPRGESLVLLGGNVLIDEGVLRASGGQVELGSVAGRGTVGLAVDGGNFRLSFPQEIARGDISLYGAQIDVAAEGGGNIAIYARNLDISNSRTITGNTLGNTYTLHVSVEEHDAGANGSIGEVEPNNSLGTAQPLDSGFSVDPNNQIEASTTIPHVSISSTGDGTFDYYSFTVSTPGSRGNFDIDDGATRGANSSAELFLFDSAGRLLANQGIPTNNQSDSAYPFANYLRYEFNSPGTYILGVGGRNSFIQRSVLNAGIARGSGSVGVQAGNIKLDATGTIMISGGSSVSNAVAYEATGKGGDINIRAESLLLTHESEIAAGTEVRGVGDSGNINVTAESLSLIDGSRLLANSSGRGNAGNVTLQISGAIVIDEIDPFRSGYVSGIFSTAESFFARGNGGNIDISAESLSLTNGARVTAETSGGGNAGNITLKVNDRLLIDGVSRYRIAGVQSTTISSGIYSIVEPGLFGIPPQRGDGGNIKIEAGSLSLTNGGQVSASTFGLGNAGNVTIEVRDGMLVDGVGIYPVFYGLLSDRNPSGVSSTVQEFAVGNGGNVNVTVTEGSLSLTNGGRLATNTLAQGDAGDVTVQVRDALLIDGVSSDGFISGAFSGVESGAVGQGGDVKVTAGSVSLTNGAQLAAETSGQGDAGNIEIEATDFVNVAGTSSVNGRPSQVFTGTNSPGEGGDITVTTHRFRVADGAVLDARTTAEGMGGDIQVNANTFEAVNGGQVRTTTFGEGNAGDITLNIADRVVISGSDPLYADRIEQFGKETVLLADPIINSTVGEAEPNNSITTAQNIDSLFALSPNSNPNPDVESSTRFPYVSILGTGDGTLDYYSFTVNTPGSRAVFDIDYGKLTGDYDFSFGLFVFDSEGRLLGYDYDNSPFLGEGGSTGYADSYIGSDRNFAFKDPGTYIVAVGEDDSYKPATNPLEPGESYTLQVSIENHQASNTRLVTTDQGSASGLLANTAEGSTGNGGSIFMNNPKNVLIQDGASIAVDSKGAGVGGNIEIQADTLTLENEARLSAETASNTGGNITLKLQDLLLLRNQSKISTTAGTAQAGGDGGNITIDTDFIVAVSKEDSDITANAFKGRGGNIDITATSIYGIEFRPRLTPLSDITASSEIGVDGVVDISTLGIDPVRGIVSLPVEPTTSEVAQDCQSSGGKTRGSFMNTGRGGLPTHPYEPLSSSEILADVQPPSQWVQNSISSPAQTTSNRLVEANGWLINQNGEVVLVAQTPPKSSQWSCSLR